MSKPPKTIEEAHAAGAAAGRDGLGPIPPRDGELRKAYMQSYRDAIVARVGIPERRRRDTNPRRKPNKPRRRVNRGKLITTTTRSNVKTVRRINPKETRVCQHCAVIMRKTAQGWRHIRATGCTRPSPRAHNPRPVVVLYATKPGMRRLKYVGRGKFGEKGRPMLFRDKAQARTAAHILKDMHRKVLRGWTLTAD